MFCTIDAGFPNALHLSVIGAEIPAVCTAVGKKSGDWHISVNRHKNANMTSVPRFIAQVALSKPPLVGVNACYLAVIA